MGAFLVAPGFGLMAEEREEPVVIEAMPQYPGGDAAMYRYLSQQLRYPAQAASKGLQGRVFVTFVVGADGKVSEARVVRKVNHMLDSEALRGVQGLHQFVSPAKVKGEAVAMRFLLPVNFVLADLTSIDSEEVRLDENIDAVLLDEVVVVGTSNN